MGMSIFHEKSRMGYSVCKKFQIGSVTLMAQMTNRKKTELTDYFHLVWTKSPQFSENVLKMEAIFSQNSTQNRVLETSISHKNSENGPTFSSKIPERVDIEAIKWHTPVRKYHEFPPRLYYSSVTCLCRRQKNSYNVVTRVIILKN